MKHKAGRTSRIVMFLFVSVFFLFACEAHDHAAGQKKFKLAPRQTKTIKFKADHETTVSFKTDISPSQKKKLKNNGIQLIYIDSKGEGEAVTSPANGSLKAKPNNGKILVKIKNLEAMSIKVAVTWK